MDRKLATDIESEGNWSDHVTVDHEYSGRGMHGDETTAIVVYNDVDANEVSLLAWKRGVRLKWDDIGYQGTVLY
tara:strand:+ start:351 stop:572 length:222 start_codon:yes stop_codon:yes gene_type:complete